MKKNFFKLMAVCSLVTVLFAVPQPAHAIIGAATANPAIVIAGTIVLGVGLPVAAGVGGIAYGVARSQPCTGWFCHAFDFMYFWIAGGISAGITTLAGLIILDQRTGTPEYPSLGLETGRRLGATPDQIRTYNRQLPQLNALAEDIREELDHNLPQNPTAEQAATMSANLWQRYAAPVLDRDTQFVVGQMGRHMAQETRLRARAH